jgi:hypothetical protein
MPSIRMKASFSEAKLRRIIGIPRQLATNVLPKVLESLVEPIQAEFVKHLPDGGPDGTNTRAKQSKKSRERWKYKLNKQLKKKRITDDLGTLMLVGIKMPEGNYVNIDFHNKATTTGRRHILWGKAFLRNRVQTQDIPKVVLFSMEGRINRTVRDGIRNAINSGELV